MGTGTDVGRADRRVWALEVEQVRFIRELYGEVEPGLRLNFSNIPLGEAQRTLRLFASDVVSDLSTSEVATPSE